MTYTKSRSSQRRGAAVVELACVLPLIVLLVIGVWEIGRMCEIQQITNNAAREGARQASTGMLHANKPAPDDDVEKVVRLYLENAFASAGVANASAVAASATITITNEDQPSVTDTFYYVDGRTSNIKQGDWIRVTVSIPLRSVRWINLYLVTSDSTQLSATIVWPCMVDKPFQNINEPPIE